MVRKLVWSFGGLILTALALLIFAASKRYGGPHIMPIAEGRGVTGADIIASTPLLAGSIQLVAGLWRRREQRIRLSLARADIVILAIGSTLGLLLAVAALLTLPSKRPAFVVFFVVMLVTSMLIAARK